MIILYFIRFIKTSDTQHVSCEPIPDLPVPNFLVEIKYVFEVHIC